MKKINKKLPRILITAGPTLERIDPVRFLSNHSTGLVGYEIAKVFRDKGFSVSLISGPVNLEKPPEVSFISVITTGDMKKAVDKRIAKHDCIIMAAAVCDFRPEKTGLQKIKKKGIINLKLVKNPDILQGIKKKGLLKIGFALETEDEIKNALGKIKAKNLDLIVLNKKTKKENPFGKGKKNYILLDRQGKRKTADNITKKQLAGLLLDEVMRLWKEKKDLR